jgi:hypothetical protein
MVRLKLWQWIMLAIPIATIVSFLQISAGWQIDEWGISWIWGVLTIIFVVVAIAQQLLCSIAYAEIRAIHRFRQIPYERCNSR